MKDNKKYPLHRVIGEELKMAVERGLEILFREALSKPLTHPRPKPDNVAPDGYVWLCQACGKRTKDKFNGTDGWDASCMLNSLLVKEVKSYE